MADIGAGRIRATGRDHLGAPSLLDEMDPSKRERILTALLSVPLATWEPIRRLDRWYWRLPWRKKLLWVCFCALAYAFGPRPIAFRVDAEAAHRPTTSD